MSTSDQKKDDAPTGEVSKGNDSTISHEIKEVAEEAVRILRSLFWLLSRSIGPLFGPLFRNAWARNPYPQYIFRPSRPISVKTDDSNSDANYSGHVPRDGLLLDEDKMTGLNEWQGFGALVIGVAILIGLNSRI